MIRDVTEYFEAAVRHAPAFQMRDLLPALRAAAAQLRAEVDFSHETGEEWLRIVEGKAVHGYLWTHGPLGIGDRTMAQVFSASGLADVLMIEVSDLDRPDLAIRSEVLEAILPGYRWPSEIDPACLSANDLWWATV